MPTRSANTPPTKGPAAEATKMNVWRVPSLEEALSGGAVAETSTVAAATVPVSEPCNNLSSRSCHGEVTRPISPSITDPASVARNSIFFCPYLSPSLPHRGAARAMVTAVAVLRRPAQAAAWPASSTPSCCT
jgi:hypothetical protein